MRISTVRSRLLSFDLSFIRAACTTCLKAFAVAKWPHILPKLIREEHGIPRGGIVRGSYLRSGQVDHHRPGSVHALPESSHRHHCRMRSLSHLIQMEQETRCAPGQFQGERLAVLGTTGCRIQAAEMGRYFLNSVYEQSKPSLQ